VLIRVAYGYGSQTRGNGSQIRIMENYLDPQHWWIPSGFFQVWRIISYYNDLRKAPIAVLFACGNLASDVLVMFMRMGCILNYNTLFLIGSFKGAKGRWNIV
jgi:hypothetical protein